MDVLSHAGNPALWRSVRAWTCYSMLFRHAWHDARVAGEGSGGAGATRGVLVITAQRQGAERR